MKSENIEKLLNALGCDKIKVSGNKVRSTCPLAPWRHGGGEDKHPSLAVFVSDDDSSGANCMSGQCGFRGSLIDLLYRYQGYSKRDVSGLMKFVYENNYINMEKQMDRIDAKAGIYSIPKSGPTTLDSFITPLGGRNYADPLVKASMSSALPDSALATMELMRTWIDEEAYLYLTGPDRRLTDATIEKWKIGWHPRYRRISVPQYDRLGRLVNLSGRHIPYWPKCVPLSDREERAPKWMHSHGFDREMFLFGEDWFELSDDGRGTVFIAEGAFDVIFLDQCGVKNVAGINGSHINQTQVDKILKWFDSVVLVMDGDPAGVTAASKIESKLAKRVHVSTYHISGGRDPNQMEIEEVEELKSRFQS